MSNPIPIAKDVPRPWLHSVLENILQIHTKTFFSVLGMYVFEKMTSGAYLGEVARHMMTTLARDGVLFGGVIPPKLSTVGGFPTSALAEIDADLTWGLSGTANVLKSGLQVSASYCDRRLVSMCDADGRSKLQCSQTPCTKCCQQFQLIVFFTIK